MPRLTPDAILPAMTTATADPRRFTFGGNWRSFLSHIDDERVAEAKSSLTSFLETPSLEGKTFLDIGCGSGIFSLAARELGAAVTSLDVDPECVACCTTLRERSGPGEGWTVREGSILDPDLVASLGTFDIVYSWGVLHHTGDMWEAVRNAASLVASSGHLYLALYNKKNGFRGSDYWTRMKRLYNAQPRLGKRAMEALYLSRYCIGSLARLRNPLRRMREHTRHRGMSFLVDVRDWLGGYPYECATVEEVRGFVSKESPALRLVRTKEDPGLGNNWYLFRIDS